MVIKAQKTSHGRPKAINGEVGALLAGMSSEVIGKRRKVNAKFLGRPGIMFAFDRHGQSGWGLIGCGAGNQRSER